MQTPVQKLLQNIKALRDQNAPKERIQAEIERWQPKIDAFNASQESEAAKLSGPETLAAGAFKVGQGITLGTLDEALGAIGTLGGKPYKETRDALRFGARQFDAENPATGLALEVAGSLALPFSAVKLAGRGGGAIGRGARALQAPGAGKAAIRSAVDGAVAGSAAGGANAESLADVPAAVALGGAAGTALGGIAGAAAPVARAVQRAYRGTTGAGAARGAREAMGDVVEKVAGETPASSPTAATEEVIAKARQAVEDAEAAGRGNEIIAAEAFGVPGLRELRGTRTVSGQAQELIDPVFGARNAKAGQRVEADVQRVLGVSDETPAAARERLIAERSAAAKPLYDAFRAEGVLEPGASLEQLLQLPIVRQAITTVKGESPTLAQLADTDAQVLDAVYKRVGSRAFRAQHGFEPGEARAHLLDGIDDASGGTYRPAVEAFAGKSAVNEAFDAGASLIRGRTDELAQTVKGLSGSEAEAFRQGAAAELLNSLREMSTNADLPGVAAQNVVARVFGKQGMATKFKEAFGEAAYKELLPALRQEITQFNNSNLVRGGSNTADKTMDAAAELGIDLAGFAAVPSPGRAMTLFGNALKAVGGDRVATEKAKLLTQQGAVPTRAVIDQLEAMLQARAASRQSGNRASTVAARVVGAQAGRP